MESVLKFLSGVFAFHGTGLDSAAPLAASLAYTVSSNRHAPLV